MREIKPTRYTYRRRGYLLLLQKTDRGGGSICANRVCTVMGPWQDLSKMFHRLFHKRTFHVAFVIFAMLPLPPKSAAAEIFTSEVSFKTRMFNTDDGLPQNSINCLKRTRDSYLWIGTESGLARFDGYHFNVFNRDNTRELVGETGDLIHALAESSDRTLWIGTPQGLVSYAHHQFRRFRKSDGLPSNDVRRIINAREGGLWLLAGNAVARFKDNKVLWSSKPPLGMKNIIAIHESPKGGLDVLAYRSWITISSDGQTITTNLIRQAPQPIWRCVVFDKADRFLIGTDRGVFRVSDRNAPLLTAAGLGEERINCLVQNLMGKYGLTLRSRESTSRARTTGLALTRSQIWTPIQ